MVKRKRKYRHGKYGKGISWFTFNQNNLLFNSSYRQNSHFGLRDKYVAGSVKNVPWFKIEKVSSVILSGFNLFLRVFSTRPFAALEIPTRFKRWAFFI